MNDFLCYRLLSVLPIENNEIFKNLARFVAIQSRSEVKDMNGLSLLLKSEFFVLHIYDYI